MPTWILHCHLGRRRVELPDPPTAEAVLDALERISPRPCWTHGVRTVPDVRNAEGRIECVSPTGETLGVFKRSNARTPQTKISVYLPPAVREQLLAAADAQGVTVSTLGGRLIAAGLDRETA